MADDKGKGLATAVITTFGVVAVACISNWDKIDKHFLHRQTATLSPSTATETSTPAFPSPTVAPTQKPPLDEQKSPSVVVRDYYDAINARSLPKAYESLSADFRARRPLGQFSKIFADTHAIAIRQISEMERTGDIAIVAISFQETDSDKRAREWRGNVYLTREEGAWRIARTDLK